MHRFPPVGLFHVRGSPTLIRNRAMNIEIFAPRAEVKPLSFLQNDATDSSALPDPISKNRNERDLLVGRDLLENRRIPNRDVGEVEFARNAVAVVNIDDAMFAESDARTQSGVTKRKRDG